MRHRNGLRKLNRTSSHRLAMLRNLASDPSSQPTLRRLRALTRDQCVPTPPGFAW